jgi:hypothetical protein
MLAEKMGAKVFVSEKADFAGLRGMGRDQAKGNFLFYVDADEIVTPELRNEIQQRIRTFAPLRDPHIYRIRRKNYYLGHAWPKVEYPERLFWKPALMGWHGILHESPEYIGRASSLRHAIEHDTHRTFAEMTRKTNEWSGIEARLRLYEDHPPVVAWRLLRVMVTGCLRSFIGERGILTGTVGIAESMFQAFSMFITYAKLFELQEKHERKI